MEPLSQLPLDEMSLPQVSLITLGCSDEVVNEFLSSQTYANIEIARTSSDDTYGDIINYITTTPSKYICFLEDTHIYSDNKILEMVLKLENTANANVVITPRNYVDSSLSMIASHNKLFSQALSQNVLTGDTFLEVCFSSKENHYGSLSCILVSTEYARNIPWKIPASEYDAINRVSLLHQLIIYGNVAYIDESLVSAIPARYNDQPETIMAYMDYVSDFAHTYQFTVPLFGEQIPSTKEPIAKDITFFYTDKGEYYNLEPIAKAAKERGYSVTFTEDIMQKAEIGVYCQHVCFPENSKFSLILLHDMAQGHNRWPNLWEAEPWDKFDIGILPGSAWSERWLKCSFLPYVIPRCGCYEFGYPKSDLINAPALKSRADELRDVFNFKYDFSVLYAPSWENDEKEDDFIRALASLNVNLLIKQAHWPAAYSHIIENIKQMRALHEGKYDNVYYIEPEESILTALELCDIVVSDESSVMAEAVMFGKPSVAVTDWLIPDTTPSRFASVPMDYVLKCKKVELREYVENLVAGTTAYDDILEKGKTVFANHGHVCSDILDAIDYYTQNAANDSFKSKKLQSLYSAYTMWF